LLPMIFQNGQADRDREKNPRHHIQKRKTFFDFENYIFI
jgi:hypothetical protein